MFFLVNHVPDGLDGFLKGVDGFNRIVFSKGFPGLFHLGPDVIVNGPHHLGGAGEVMGLQHGEKLVFLAGIVGVDFRQLFDELPQFLAVRFKGFGCGGLAQQTHKHAGVTHNFFRCPVFLHIGVDRMAQGRVRPVLFFQSLFENFHMCVAKPLDLLGRQAFVHELLLHFGDFRRLNPLDQIPEPLLKNFHVSAVVKVFYDSLQGGLPFPGIGQGFALGDGAVSAAAVLFDLGAQQCYQRVKVQSADRRCHFQGGHFAHGFAHDGIFQALELGRQGDEKLF